MISDEDRRDPQRLYDFMKNHSVGHVYMPYVALNILAEHALGLDEDYWPEHIFTAGEQLICTDAFKRLYQKFPASRLHNFYGPTETHVVTTYSLTALSTDWSYFPPIGKAIDRTRIYILDDALMMVPTGGIGELYAGGICVARGYLNRPGLTAERFLADPFMDDGSRMYATGDLVRVGTDGEVEFLGRKDDQVKIRGYRVEIAEVENTLLEALPEVDVLAVVAQKLGSETRLFCFVKSKPTTKITSEMMHKAALNTLPSYMRPFANFNMDDVPYTTSGKLDRRALGELVPKLQEDDSVKQLPETTEQVVISEAFGSILGTDGTGLDDNFFALGGSSLDAMKLMVRINSALDVSISVRDIFASPTPRKLAYLATNYEKPTIKNALRRGKGSHVGS